MNCGLDFGTANCSIGVWRDGSPVLIDLSENSKQLSSALHSIKSNIEVISIDETELSERVSRALASQANQIASAASVTSKSMDVVLQQISDGPNKVILREEISSINTDRRKERSELGELKEEKHKELWIRKVKEIKKKYDSAIAKLVIDALNRQKTYRDSNGTLKPITSGNQIKSRERALMRREVAEIRAHANADEGISSALYADNDICFGNAAIFRHMEDPNDGYFVKSPKSFLGAELSQRQKEVFIEIVIRFFAFLKSSAQNEVSTDLQNVVIGKPINFHGTQGENGNNQALDILYKGAISAGFRNIEFLYEPIAAALHFERSLTKDKVVLVLDAGGGTTDCSVIKLGPSHKNRIDRGECVLGNSGARIGGTDLDHSLAMRTIMPLFGLTSDGVDLGIPNIVFSNAITQNDINARAKFLSWETGRDIDFYLRSVPESHVEKIHRLREIYDKRLGFRLNRSAELAKIALSKKDSITLPLNYIEDDLTVQITLRDLEDSIHRKLGTMTDLMEEALRQAGKAADIIYVTGGTAKSPVVEDYIRKRFSDTEIVIGDHFGSVASGLTTWASKIF